MLPFFLLALLAAGAEAGKREPTGGNLTATGDVVVLLAIVLLFALPALWVMRNAPEKKKKQTKPAIVKKKQ